LGYELDVLYLRQQLVLRGYPEGIVVAPKYDPAARIQHLMRFQSRSKRTSKSWDKIVLTLPFAESLLGLNIVSKMTILLKAIGLDAQPALGFAMSDSSFLRTYRHNTPYSYLESPG
jgi:hypothetical protein